MKRQRRGTTLRKARRSSRAVQEPERTLEEVLSRGLSIRAIVVARKYDAPIASLPDESLAFHIIEMQARMIECLQELQRRLPDEPILQMFGMTLEAGKKIQAEVNALKERMKIGDVGVGIPPPKKE